jgi:autotransporter-associated beta strand protein
VNSSASTSFSGLITNATGSTLSVVKSGTGTFTLSNSNTYTGSTAVNAGRLRFFSDLTTSNSVTLNGGTLELTPAQTRVIHTPTLTINGGRLDIQDNKLITTATPVGSWTGSNYTGVTGMVTSGRGTGNLWDGAAGIVTSQTAAVGSNYTTIAVAQASDVRPATATATDLWAGQSITGTDTLVMYTYGGDATLDGKINIDDYIRIDSGIASGLTGWSNGDFNYDGKVNIDDYTQFIDSNIGTQGAQFPTAGGIGGGVSAVPEPGAVMLFLIAAMPPLIARRHRRQ